MQFIHEIFQRNNDSLQKKKMKRYLNQFISLEFINLQNVIESEWRV